MFLQKLEARWRYLLHSIAGALLGSVLTFLALMFGESAQNDYRWFAGWEWVLVVIYVATFVPAVIIVWQIAAEESGSKSFFAGVATPLLMVMLSTLLWMLLQFFALLVLGSLEFARSYPLAFIIGLLVIAGVALYSHNQRAATHS
ncbi:hypothetical protein KW785_01245 [Candidatus Parcubacteria bacterium]|nr:hypothetical protein [Candidatus Parcubacteria bacterium]